MATKVDIAGTNISASQASELFRLAAISGSHVNRGTLQAYLEGRNPFGDPDFIRVDRSTRPTYPDFAKKDWINQPEFIRIEETGPAEYSPSSLVLSLHPKQEQGGVAIGHEVWAHQKELGIEGCLGLTDLLEIQKLGLATFRRYFQGKVVFAWKSVVQDGDGSLNVPYLFENDGQVFLLWFWLDVDWSAGDPALRFAR